MNRELGAAEELQGVLGHDEAVRRSRQSKASLAARQQYESALSLTYRARKMLLEALAEGLPRLERAALGGYEPSSALAHAAAARFINSFVGANRVLHAAAAQLCDVDNLPDKGVADGVEWEVRL